jgi:hypothetical protein
MEAFDRSGHGLAHATGYDGQNAEPLKSTQLQRGNLFSMRTISCLGFCPQKRAQGTFHAINPLI